MTLDALIESIPINVWIASLFPFFLRRLLLMRLAELLLLANPLFWLRPKLPQSI
jgi:hypothetical protein